MNLELPVQPRIADRSPPCRWAASGPAAQRVRAPPGDSGPGRISGPRRKRISSLRRSGNPVPASLQQPAAVNAPCSYPPLRTTSRHPQPLQRPSPLVTQPTTSRTPRLTAPPHHGARPPSMNPSGLRLRRQRLAPDISSTGPQHVRVAAGPSPGREPAAVLVTGCPAHREGQPARAGRESRKRK